MLSVAVGSRNLAGYTYNTGNGTLKKQTCGNGDHVSYTYDDLGRTKTVTYSGGRVLTYTYNGEDQLHSITETGSGSTVQYLYTYDSIGRLVTSEKLIDGEMALRTSQSYDENNRLVSQSWQLPDRSYTNTYTYNTTDGSLATFKSGSGATQTVGYDELRRVSAVTGYVAGRSYTYRDISETETTTQIASLSYPNLAIPLTYEYTYDAAGNITTISDALQGAKSYTYDAQGQMTKEVIGSATYTYSYDKAGNITGSTNSTGSHTYTYSDSDWGDLLTAYDGQSITYDAIGNPTSYYNGTRWTFEWEQGRQLRSMSDGTTTWSCSYDANGLRTKRTKGTKTYEYTYTGDRLTRMIIDDNGTIRTLSFYYDADGPLAINVTNSTQSTTYYYVKNAQGDITAIVNKAGTAVVEYSYDAWGNLLSIEGDYKNGLGIRNPLRYRGYVYDTDTSLYYCQSRYYDPATGRFLNADALTSTGQGILGNNMFAYCNNNPTNNLDSSGTYLVEIGLIIHDIYQLTRDDEEQVTAEKTSNSVKIRNSNKIITPLVQLGYSAYQNYWGEYKDYFIGSSLGMTFEWTIHNIGFLGFDALVAIGDFFDRNTTQLKAHRDSCSEVDLGPTIYYDTGTGTRGKFSAAMKTIYTTTLPSVAIFDMVKDYYHRNGA